MKNMKNKKVILSSILSLILCVSLIVGGTFALFTSESKTNIAVTSGKVNVQATLEIEDIYRPTLLNEDGSVKDANNLASKTNVNEATFGTGGFVKVDGADIAINEMLPGDKVTFKVTTTNNSTVQFKQRVELKCVDTDKSFFEQLLLGYKDRNATDYTYYKGYATEWESSEEVYKDGNTVVEYITVELPGFVGDDYQGKTCNIAFNVVAVQGNADTTDTSVAETYSVVKDAESLGKQIAMAEDGAEIMVMSPITEPVVIKGAAMMALEEEVEASKAKTVTLRGYKINSLKVEDNNTIVHVYNDVDALIGANAVKADDVATADDLFAVAKALESTEWAYYVNFVDDVDLTGKTWTPINLWDPENSNVITFNGNGKTIKNMNVEGGSKLGFIGENARDIKVDSLNFDGANVTTWGSMSAVVIGYQYGDVVLNNVSVTNSNITSTAEKGIRLGGLVGQSFLHDGATLSVTNCNVSDTTVTGYHNVAGLVGSLMNYSTLTDKWTMTGNLVTNCTFNATNNLAPNVAYASAYAVEGGNGYKYSFVASHEYFDDNKEANNKFVLGGLTYITDKTVEIYTAEELVAFSNAVNAGNTFKGITVTLANNIDMNGVAYTPAGNVMSYPSTTFAGTFDGNHMTISNLLAEDTSTNLYASAGLFGSITGVVENLIIDNATVNSTHYAGGIVGYSSTNTGMRIENCVVKNSKITSTVTKGTSENPDGWNNGDKAGGIIGYMVVGDVVTGCTVENTSITAYRDLGGIVGHAAGTVTNNAVKNVTLTIDKVVEHNYKGYTDDKQHDAGIIIGEMVATAKVEGNTENGEIVTFATIATPSELKSILTEFTDAGSGNSSVTITSDIVFADGETWTPVVVDGYNGSGVITIDGQGHTISGLNAPLFAGGFAGESGIVIKNLTIADSKIVSTNTLGSGAFIETIDSMQTITLENCHLKNSTVTGSRTGGLIGWNSGYNNENDGPVYLTVTITDCTVTDCEITGAGTVGGIVGHAGANAWTTNSITGCKVENTQLTSNDDSYRVGAIVGTANVGEVTITNCTSTDNTIKQNNNGTEITRPEGQSDLYGRFVPQNGSGQLTINGTAIN